MQYLKAMKAHKAHINAWLLSLVPDMIEVFTNINGIPYCNGRFPFSEDI